MLAPEDEAFLNDLRRRRELVAGRLPKLDPKTKEYLWEKEQLDDLDKAIRKLSTKPEFIRPDSASIILGPDNE